MKKTLSAELLEFIKLDYIRFFLIHVVIKYDFNGDEINKNVHASYMIYILTKVFKYI